MTDGYDKPILDRPTTELPSWPTEAPKAKETEAAESTLETAKPAGEKQPTENEGKQPLPLRLHKTPPPIPQVRDAVTVKIEKILEEGMGDAYSRLSPIAKQEFKLKGEETAKKISELLKSAHVKVKKIFQLILSWLKLLPGINRFFLEQEAKIKTDRIIALQQKK